MRKDKLIVMSGFALLSLTGFIVFYSLQEKTSTPQKYTSHSLPLPVIFRHSVEDIRGTSTPLDSAWNLYTNKTLGFELVYPKRQFGYGVLKTGEKKEVKPRYDPHAAGDPFYEIVFSDGDTSFYVEISPSRSSDIDTWFTEQGQEYLHPDYEIRERIVGTQKAIVIRHLPVIQTSREEDIREHLIYIQDDVLYNIDVSFLKNEERERIFESFRVFDR